jgi:hypothetical protein
MLNDAGLPLNSVWSEHKDALGTDHNDKTSLSACRAGRTKVEHESILS